jgi:hypothetical protein
MHKVDADYSRESAKESGSPKMSTGQVNLTT